MVFRLFGPVAALWVIPVMGSLSLLALYLVVRDWVTSGWGLLAAALMAVNPFANFHALGADSHTAVCFFLMWGLFGLISWERTRSVSWALLCGFCLGMIPTIRYAEAVFFFAFAYYVWRSWRPIDGFCSMAAGVIGAAVPIVALAVRNHEAFGAFWRTGYSISGEQTGFGIGYLIGYFFPYLVLLLTLGAGAVFLVGARGIVVLCQRPDTRLRGQLLAALVLPITLLYMSYYHRPSHNSTRFLLPTFFIYTIAAVQFLKIRTENEPARGKKETGILLGLTILWGLPLSLYELQALERDNAMLASVSRALQRYVEPGSILIAHSGLQQHLDFVGGWRLAPEEALEGRTGPRRPGGPHGSHGGAPPSAEGPSPAETSRLFRQQVARWAGDQHRVFWMTTQSHLREMSNRFGTDDQWVTVAEIVVPGKRGRPRDEPAGAPQGPGPRGPGRGWFGWVGPPPPPPEQDRRPESPREFRREGRGRPGGPPRLEVPADGKFLLVELIVRKTPLVFVFGPSRSPPSGPASSARGSPSTLSHNGE